MTDSHVNFPPLTNGIDYLVSVVDHLSQTETSTPSDRDLKYAVLHLQAAVEVLLKRRLQTEHWTLVIKDSNKATREKFNSGDFLSVTVDEAVRRLKEVTGIPITEGEFKPIKRLSKLRNQLQHWGLRTSVAEIESLAAQVLDFLMNFVDDNLANELVEEESELLSESLEQVRSGLEKIKIFVEHKLERISSDLAEENLKEVTVNCPQCGHLTLVVDDYTGSCRYCSSTWTGNMLIETYLSEVLYFSWKVIADGGTSPLSWCPYCGNECLVNEVITAASHDIPVLFCFACAEPFDNINICTFCGEAFIAVEDETVCGECIERQAAKWG